MEDNSTYVYQYTLDAPVTTPPRRVVSLVPSVTETLFDIGVGDRLVGITDECVYPEVKVDRVPRVGLPEAPDVDRIVQMQPDLVMMNFEENRKEDAEALEAVGIPVWVMFPKTVREAFNLIWNMMYLFEETSMVERIRSIEWAIDWNERLAELREDNPCKVFVPLRDDPLITVNADTFTHDLLAVCGGTNVFADLGEMMAEGETDVEALAKRYPTLTDEQVEAAQPDVILLPTGAFPFTEADIPRFAALDVPAAKQEGAIRVVDGQLLTWHGTRIAYALNEIPGYLCPTTDEDAP